MSQSLCSKTKSFRLIGSLCVLVLSFAGVIAQETTEAKRPALDLEGNKIFAKATLLEVVNSRLDEWAKNGARYNPQMLDYCVHQLDMFMKSHGYLQAHTTQGNVEQTEAGPRILLTVVEGPLYRVGKMTVDGATLITSEQVLNEIGLKTGDIASGEKLNDGLYERLQARYAKIGYIHYTAEVTPTFHAEKDAAEGVVDFALTIDEGEQFRIRSIKIVGADRALTALLTRELMLRDGDIFDDELFRESVKRLSASGLVEPIDADKDSDFLDLQAKQRQAAYSRKQWDADVGPALLDLTIRVKPGTALSKER
jgi:outer membrane protein insertion porin family